MMLNSMTLVACLLACMISIVASELPLCDVARDYKNGKLYQALGVSPSATAKEIKTAFKKIAVKCHPDKDKDNKYANDNFVAIAGAYETLSDVNERQRFDRSQWQPKALEDISLTDILKDFYYDDGEDGLGQFVQQGLMATAAFFLLSALSEHFFGCELDPSFLIETITMELVDKVTKKADKRAEQIKHDEYQQPN